MKRIFVYMMALFLTGCVTMPPIPAFKVAPGDRIGVLVDVDDGSMHTHIGTTIFNNFEKDYPYDWNLDAEVTRTLMNSMRERGLEVLDLEKSGFKHADVAGLITAANEKWILTKGKEDTYRKLLKQYNLKAVVVIKNVTVIAALECSGGPCSERYVRSTGLYTRSFFGFTRYHAVAAFKWNAYILDPHADLIEDDSLQKSFRYPTVPLGGFAEPANFESLTEAEMLPVRAEVLRYTEQISNSIASALQNSK